MSDIVNQLTQKLNAFLRDDPILNELIEGKESSPAQLRDALEASLDDWNTTPPPIPFVTYETHPSRRLLIRGAVIEILESAGILQSRNRLQYNDGGITVSVSDKDQSYASWINSFASRYETKKLQIKKSINITRGYGSVPSEYYNIHGDI